MQQKYLSDEHKELLRKSGIAPDVAEERGYWTVTREEALGYDGISEKTAGAGMMHNLCRIDGEHGGYQLRYDEPKLNSKGKLRRYMTPWNQKNVLDVHPRIRDRITRTTPSGFVITEGARKGDALVSLGIAAMTMTGVWNWRGSSHEEEVGDNKRTTTVLADWEFAAIKWNKLAIAFDTDIKTNDSVVNAYKRLKEMLAFKGGIVGLLLLPDVVEDGKTGIDDYIFHMKETGYSDEEIRQAIDKLWTEDVEEVLGEPPLPYMTALDIMAEHPDGVDWIWDGFIGGKVITELNAKIKDGKTTLALALCRAVIKGETFLGYPTKQTNVVYLYEGTSATLQAAIKRVGLDKSPEFRVLLQGKVRGRDWGKLIRQVKKDCREFEVGLVVVDTLSKWAGIKEENNSNDGVDGMGPIEELVESGVAALDLRHDRKAGGDLSDSARGANSISGVSDVILGLRRKPGKDDNKRILKGIGRFDETPEELVIEFDKNTGVYTSLGTQQAVQQNLMIEFIRENIAMDATADGCVTEEDFKNSWDDDKTWVRSTFKRAMEILVQSGEVWKKPDAVKRKTGYYLSEVSNGDVPLDSSIGG